MSIAHWHSDRREPGETSCRLMSACEACDALADDSRLAYDDFPFGNDEDFYRRTPGWKPASTQPR